MNQCRYITSDIKIKKVNYIILLECLMEKTIIIMSCGTKRTRCFYPVSGALKLMDMFWFARIVKQKPEMYDKEDI